MSKNVQTPTPGKRIPVGGGVYKYTDQSGEVTYHERPFINGKRTWRSLGFNGTKQTNLKLAKEEYCRRRAEVAAGHNPYEAVDASSAKSAEAKPVVSQIIKDYVAAQYPDRYLKPKTGRTLESERLNCETLLDYWNGTPWDKVLPLHWDAYHAHRLKKINGEKTTGLRGDRAIDLERNTLNNAFKLALRRGIITSNPIRDFAKFHSSTAVRHCREFKPNDADELHAIAEKFFETDRAELGWQLLIEACSGLRTSEVLMLRMDASRPGEPGYVDPEGNLHVQRCKSGINPFVHLNDGLKAVLAAHKAWHAANHPGNPYYIPGKVAGEPMSRTALSHGLQQVSETFGRKITSHGMRAWYVLIRRSWGVEDGIIAIELGQGSGAGLIATTYGSVPANWRNGGGPKMSWLPKGEPAWSVLDEAKA